MRLIWAGLAVAGLYSGYWLAGTTVLERGAAMALEGARAEGRGNAEALETGGFPARFALNVTRPELADPVAGWHWSAPSAQLWAPGWSPLELHLDMHPESQLTLGGQRFTLTNSTGSGRLSLGLAPDLPLKGVQAELRYVALRPEGSAEATLAAARIDAAAERTDAPATYRVTAGVGDVTLPPGTMADALGAPLPDRIDALTLDATLRLDADLSATAQTTPPRIEEIDLQALSLDWAGRGLSASGGLRITATGQPEGTIQISTAEWRDWLDIAVAAGWIEARRLPALTGLGAYIAQQNGGVLRVPLAFQSGRASLGPVPLGPAPVLQRQ
ncbi:DUF2125 domain-containing protein [Sinirhodobacter sp. WL0062]|uniref:DUF2125 domain-containing protein n=1 Tax=Rhodobacter flavimaris TaxID=2907145 RepID=A0ABS8Z279_9RHOB|nr:DUF2125 domain-containing protein [Sinirhodobacter sp. WL0062]MCE5975156.1 DUF2125 domain-containing protein [Sinirhodobacter sp. WL0062]